MIERTAYDGLDTVAANEEVADRRGVISEGESNSAILRESIG